MLFSPEILHHGIAFHKVFHLNCSLTGELNWNRRRPEDDNLKTWSNKKHVFRFNFLKFSLPSDLNKS